MPRARGTKRNTMKKSTIFQQIKHSAQSLLRKGKHPAEYRVSWEGAESVENSLRNINDAPKLITCLPVCADKMRRIINVYPAKSTPLYYAKYYDRMIRFNRSEYLSAYAEDSGYGYLKENITKILPGRDAHEYSFDKLIYIDDQGHIEKEVIPAFSSLTVYPTNLPNTYYVDYGHSRKLTAPPESNGAALVTDRFLVNACIVNPIISWTTNLIITGPGVNISWKLTGTKDPLFTGWFKQITVQLAAVFRFGFTEAIRAFAPGIQRTIDDFQKILPYIDGDPAVSAGESLSEFLTEIYQSIYSMGGFPSTDACRTPADFALEELRSHLNDNSIVVRNTADISKAYADFRKNLEIRKDLLKEFTKI